MWILNFLLLFSPMIVLGIGTAVNLECKSKPLKIIGAVMVITGSIGSLILLFGLISVLAGE